METLQGFPQSPRPWSECENFVRRLEKLRVRETCIPSVTSPQSPRPSSDYDGLSRRKLELLVEEVQEAKSLERPPTDHECIYELGRKLDTKGHLSRCHLQPILKSEDPVETETKEAREYLPTFSCKPRLKTEGPVERGKKEQMDIGFTKLPKISMSFTGLSNVPRKYENIGWGRRDHWITSGFSSPINKDSGELTRPENVKMTGPIQIQRQPTGLHIPTETEEPSTTFGGKWEPKPMCGKITETAPKSSTHSLYVKMKHFPRFQYVYNLVRDCKSRVENYGKGRVRIGEMFKYVIIKIVIVGNFTQDNLHLLSKSAEKKTMPKGKHIWKVQPLVCFENDYFSELNIKKGNLENTCHKILIKSNTFCDKRDNKDDSIIIVETNKKQIKETITSCLEKPLHLMLQEWLEVLKTEDSSRLASGLIAEIEAIKKQMKSCIIKDRDNSSVLRSAGAGSIVPDNIIDFLFRRPGVHSFGIWWNSSFKVFVNETDEKRLRDDLTKMNPTFFANYDIEIETGRHKDKLLYLMQGDEIQAKIPNKQKFNAGTLGGIVTKADDENKKYALTCHHLFPKVGERAYNKNFEDIGACFYTTKEKSCDFAAIEIKKPFSENCNETFQNEDWEITNAQVFSENLKNVGIVHKIGATTKVTKGIILSSEYYDKLLDHNNREHVFLVKGIQGNFSEEGDSGSLVFTRSKNAQQACVDVLGMVYSNKEDDDDEQNSKNEEDNESSNTSPSSEGDNAATNVKEKENISSCYRIHTALELFKQNKGEEVKFKDDLLLSSPESSSEFDDSNEETPQ